MPNATAWKNKQSYPNRWQVGCCEAVCSPCERGSQLGFCAILPPIAAYIQRRQLLQITDQRYKCCNGYCDPICDDGQGSGLAICDNRNNDGCDCDPKCCVLGEALLFPCYAVTTNRYMIQNRWKVRNSTLDDNMLCPAIMTCGIFSRCVWLINILTCPFRWIGICCACCAGHHDSTGILDPYKESDFQVSDCCAMTFIDPFLLPFSWCILCQQDVEVQKWKDQPAQGKQASGRGGGWGMGSPQQQSYPPINSGGQTGFQQNQMSMKQQQYNATPGTSGYMGGGMGSQRARPGGITLGAQPGNAPPPQDYQMQPSAVPARFQIPGVHTTGQSPYQGGGGGAMPMNPGQAAYNTGQQQPPGPDPYNSNTNAAANAVERYQKRMSQTQNNGPQMM